LFISKFYFHRTVIRPEYFGSVLGLSYFDALCGKKVVDPPADIAPARAADI
jgi:hypothetical protein